MPIAPKAWTLLEEITWLRAHVENTARRYGMRPEDVCDLLIEEVCR